ncbi:hypothetical protein [Paracoccus methylarcula]|uniref:hypothetical protein n=1 Tax=Paracoccus methylarcula TaxID=72022 RepID=UPI0011CD9069|nr:hypothetical protein [Paracoccus methylarcula]
MAGLFAVSAVYDDEIRYPAPYSDNFSCLSKHTAGDYLDESNFIDVEDGVEAGYREKYILSRGPLHSFLSISCRNQYKENEGVRHDPLS